MLKKNVVYFETADSQIFPNDMYVLLPLMLEVVLEYFSQIVS